MTNPTLELLRPVWPQHCVFSLGLGRHISTPISATSIAAVASIRRRSWQFLEQLLDAAQAKLRQHQGQWIQLHAGGAKPAEVELTPVKARLEQSAHLVDGIAMQLYFASGAFDEKRNKEEEQLPSGKRPRFWQEAAPLFAKLAVEPHPHTT